MVEKSGKGSILISYIDKFFIKSFLYNLNLKLVFFSIGTDSVQLVTIQAKPKPGIHREYDQFTLACLAIQFPSAETKTEGIPKVSVPHPDMEER